MNLCKAILLMGVVSLSVLAAMAAEPTTQAGADQDWPKWRGPRGDNLPAAKNFPADISKLKKLWTATGLADDKKSAGWSCPVVQGDKLVAAGRSGANDIVICLNADTGKDVWRKEYAAAGADVQYGNGPRATPTIDGDRVYTFGCMGHLVCWSLADGKQLWMKTSEDLGGKQPKWGHSSTPLVYGDKLLVQAGGKALVTALDKKTGEKVWTSAAGSAGYAAITTAKFDGKEQLLVFAADGLVGMDPTNGKQLWKFDWPTSYGMNCATPIQLGQRLLITSWDRDSKGGAALLEMGADGPKLVWENHSVAAMHNDPVVIDGFIYFYTGFSLNDGSLGCFDLKDGKQKWASKDAGGPGNVVQVGDQILCLNNRGKLILAKPSAESFQKVSELDAITGNPVWTQPIIARGKLYVRFGDELVCYSLGQ